MKSKAAIEERAWEMLSEVCNNMALRGVDAEYVREGGENYLRLYIDKEGGVTIDDCETVSRAVEEMLDKEETIDDQYILEVSSPGLGRRLRRPRDFEFALGKEVDIRFFQADKGRKALKGVLTAFTDDTIELETEEGKESFQRKAISSAKLSFEI